MKKPFLNTLSDFYDFFRSINIAHKYIKKNNWHKTNKFDKKNSPHDCIEVNS